MADQTRIRQHNGETRTAISDGLVALHSDRAPQRVHDLGRIAGHLVDRTLEMLSPS